MLNDGWKNSNALRKSIYQRKIRKTQVSLLGNTQIEVDSQRTHDKYLTKYFGWRIFSDYSWEFENWNRGERQR